MGEVGPLLSQVLQSELVALEFMNAANMVGSDELLSIIIDYRLISAIINRPVVDPI
jgi:hypothetical protein